MHDTNVNFQKLVRFFVRNKIEFVNLLLHMVVMQQLTLLLPQLARQREAGFATIMSWFPEFAVVWVETVAESGRCHPGILIH